jgi:formiminoglutamate deiminase
MAQAGDWDGMKAVHLRRALLPAGWASDVRLVFRDGLIASVETGCPPAGADARHAVGVPGIANVHSHAFQRAMAGLTEQRGPSTDTFWTWRETMYRFALAIGPEETEAVAALLYAEMLEAGFTAVGEFHYLHHAPDGQPYDNIAELADRIVAAAAHAGIGLTLLPVFYAHGNFGGAPPTAGQRRFLNDPARFARLMEASRASVARLPGARIGVAPHSLRAATAAELAAVIGLAGDGPVHMHIAEQRREVEDSRAWSGETPVAWLLRRFPVGPRWCLIHATHMTPDETIGLAHTGAVAGLCPLTEGNLGDGTFPALLFRESGGHLGVGSDSNVQIGVAAELRQLEYAQRLSHRERNVLAEAGGSTGRALIDAAVAGGAQALGGGPHGLAIGAAADLVTLDVANPLYAHLADDRLLDAWVFSAGNALVDCVWARGVQQVEAGRHRDRPALAARFRSALARLSG